MAIYGDFQVAAFRHFGFYEIEILSRLICVVSQCAQSCQISRGSVNPLLRYGDFYIFKTAAIRHLGSLQIRNFNG